VIRRLAEALDVALADLVGEPVLLEWTTNSGVRTVPPYVQCSWIMARWPPALAVATAGAAPDLGALQRAVGEVFDAYQASRYAYVAGRTPLVLADAFAPHALWEQTTVTAPTPCLRLRTRRWCLC
jgi:hypothetical protein